MAKHVPQVGDIVRIARPHRWEGVFAIVNTVEPYGIEAIVRIPFSDGWVGVLDTYIHLAGPDFEVVGAPPAV